MPFGTDRLTNQLQGKAYIINNTNIKIFTFINRALNEILVEF